MWMCTNFNESNCKCMFRVDACGIYAVTIIGIILGRVYIFLSGRNQMYIVFAIGLLSICFYYGVHDIRYKLYLGMSIICILYGESSSNLLAITFFVLLAIVGFERKCLRKILSVAVLVLYPLLNMGIVIFRIHEHFAFFYRNHFA